MASLKFGINTKIAFTRFSFAEKTFGEWTSFAPIGTGTSLVRQPSLPLLPK
jgi:hypothetical protein